MDRPPNTQECKDFGSNMTKLPSGVECDSGTVMIGSTYDDKIFSDSEMAFAGEDKRFEDRSLIIVDDLWSDNCSIDLEDVIRFAANNCRGIVDRVLKEVDDA